MLPLIPLLALASAAQAGGKKQEIDPSCSLARDVKAESDRPIVASLSRKFPSSDVSIEIQLPKKSSEWPTKGSLDVAIGSEISAAKLDYEIVRTAAGRSQLKVSLPPAILRKEVQPVITLKGEGSPLELSTDGWTDALAWLTACREKQIAATGIPPVELEEGMTRAVGAPGFWITDNDVAGMRGQIKPGIYRGYMIWRIELDGTVKNCRFLTSTGHTTLDDRICQSIIERGHYLKPAVNSQGENVVSWTSRQMTIHL